MDANIAKTRDRLISRLRTSERPSGTRAVCDRTRWRAAVRKDTHLEKLHHRSFPVVLVLGARVKDRAMAGAVRQKGFFRERAVVFRFLVFGFSRVFAKKLVVISSVFQGSFSAGMRAAVPSPSPSRTSLRAGPRRARRVPRVANCWTMGAVVATNAVEGTLGAFPNSALAEDVQSMLFVAPRESGGNEPDHDPPEWRFKPMYGTLDWRDTPNEPPSAVEAAESLKRLGRKCVLQIDCNRLTPKRGAHEATLAKLVFCFRKQESSSADSTEEEDTDHHPTLTNYQVLTTSVSVIERRCVDLFLASAFADDDEDEKTKNPGKPLFSEILLSRNLSAMIVGKDGETTDASIPDNDVTFASTWPLRKALHPLCLNLRNVTWHGFLAPGDVSPELAALALVLACSIPGSWSSSDFDLHANARSSRETQKLARCDDEVFDKNETSLPSRRELRRDIEQTVLGSSFFSPGWRDTVSNACVDFLSDTERIVGDGYTGNDGDFEKQYPSRWDTFQFIARVAPATEHALRVLYAYANDAPEVIHARLGAYYATLDGYGQANAHDVLLHPWRAGVITGADTDRARNKFRDELPQHALLVLRDLCMRDKGPSLRATYAHGGLPFLETDTFCDEGDEGVFRTRNESRGACAYLFLAAVRDLCAAFRDDGDDATGGFKFVELNTSLTGYKTVFHPRIRVQNALTSALTSLVEVQIAEHECRVLEDGNSETLVTFCERSTPRVSFHAKPESPETITTAKEDEATLVEICRVVLSAYEAKRSQTADQSRDALGSIARAFLAGEAHAADCGTRGNEKSGSDLVLDHDFESIEEVNSGIECLRQAACEVKVACEKHVGSIERLVQLTERRAARSGHRKRLVANVTAVKAVQGASIVLLLLVVSVSHLPHSAE